MSFKIGEVSWDDEVVVGNADRKTNYKDMFLKLESGPNIVRIITKAHQYVSHKWKPEGDEKGYGHRVMCSKPGPGATCPLCDDKTNPDRPKRRWFLGVIDRKTDTYKILDVSITVFKAIQALARDEDWGTPDKYDIDITVDRQGGATGYYTVKPKPHKALTASDLQKKEMANSEGLEELKRKVQPPTFEKVEERMKKIMEGLNGGVTVQASSGGKANKVEVASEEDDDEDFPNADTKAAPF